MKKNEHPPHQPVQWSWQQLQGKIDPLLFAAPKLDWNHVDSRNIRYLVRNVAGSLWINQLAFATLVLSSDQKMDPSSIYQKLTGIHSWWRHLFPTYKLATFQAWDPEIHLVRYLEDLKIKDSQQTRYQHLQKYFSAAKSLHSYLRKLPLAERNLYQQWAFPQLAPELYRLYSRRRELREAAQEQAQKKADAVTPHYAKIRGEAHFRWNALFRLKTQYQQAIACVEAGQAELPLAFSYEEPRWGRLHFLLWDRPHFVRKHRAGYSRRTNKKVTSASDGFRPELNHYFLEFTGAESLTDPNAPPDPAALLWFGDLLKEQILGDFTRGKDSLERKRRQAYLRSWGYESKAKGGMAPFSTSMTGILNWPVEQASFMHRAQNRAKGLLLLVEPLFVATTFGLAALDVFTTTGARINELLQINLSSECLHSMTVGGKERLILKLVPKMEEESGEYWIGEETKRNFKKVIDLLQECYHLQAGEPIPWVPFNSRSSRTHRFQARPYLFQYNREHLLEKAVTACLRFLCHGMIFQAADGQIVVLHAHLLRHVFATHLHQVKKVPLDIVSVLLHHRNVTVTSKYAAPMEQDITRERESFLEELATKLGDWDEFVARVPEELRQQLEEARESVGALQRVIGGDCTCGDMCPWGFSCTGCIYKVPDPGRREEMVSQRTWAEERLAYAQAHRLTVEVRKLQILVQRIDLELEEMRLIEDYREDEQYKPLIQVQRIKQGASMAPRLLRSQAGADGTVGPVYG